MKLAAARERRTVGRERSLAARLYGVLPVAIAFVWLCLLYAWESKAHKTPWLFSDELQLAQLSRAISETGHAARRGAPHGFQSLYSYVIAPAWFIGDMHRAYATLKYIGVVTMTASLFPAYALARTIVGRPAALFAGVATASIPALIYSPMLIPEPLAYPYSVLCLFLIVKVLATRRKVWIASAVVASLLAGFVRGELALMPVVLGFAAAFLFWHSPRPRAWRRSWGSWDWVGFVVLAIGILIVLNTLIGHHSRSFDIATGHYKQRMYTYGLWAVGALGIGVGVLPLVAGLAALLRPRDEPRTPAMRAFLATAAAAILCFSGYTAIKASYLSTVFATRVEERNIIYLAPVLLVGTALWLERPRLRLGALLATSLFALYLVFHTPYQLETRLSADAPGLSVLALGNRDLGFDDSATRWLLLGTLAVAVALLVAPRFLGGRRRLAMGAAGLAAGLVVAWSLAGQIAAGNASNAESAAFLRGQPAHTDWVDRNTGGAPTMYLGQKVNDPNGVWSLEFWNRSLRYVWSLDGTAKGPGPTETPNIDGLDGHLQQQRGELKYVVTDSSIDVVGRVKGTGTYLEAGQPVDWKLFQVAYPVRLRDAHEGIYSDGWMGADGSYTLYSSAGRRTGTVSVTVSRRGWGGPNVPGQVEIKVGPLGLSPDHQPTIGRVTGRRHWVVGTHDYRQFDFPNQTPPLRVEIHISPTFVPAKLDPGSSDLRPLGAVVGFGFEPYS